MNGYDRMMWLILTMMLWGFVASGIWIWMWSGDWEQSTLQTGVRQVGRWGLSGSGILFGITYWKWKDDNRGENG